MELIDLLFWMWFIVLVLITALPIALGNKEDQEKRKQESLRKALIKINLKISSKNN